MAEIRCAACNVIPGTGVYTRRTRFTHSKRNGSAKMSAPKPFTALVLSTQGIVPGRRARTKCPQFLWKQIFRPCALGLIGLAIAVALWGFSYKLSLYHRHTGPSSRISVAKLWIDPRSASVVAATCGLKVQSHLLRISQVFAAPIQRFPRSSRAVAYILPECRHTVAYFDFLIPFRSPPAQRFSMA